MDIDFIIPWVNGGDPEWLQLMETYSTSHVQKDPCRFRDWNILKFWFRAVEQFAPWVRRIHFVTCGQIPDWLNTEHPKLRIVDHKDYIPQEYLPTFSSHTIELNFHRIPGLAEHFVYFNDDMLLNGPVQPDDFFRNGLPCDCAILDQFLPMGIEDAYCHAQCNVMAFINRHFDKHRLMRQAPGLWFSPVYGKYLLKNLYYAPPRLFSNFQNGHVASSMLKSTYETVWQMEPELLSKTCHNKFRSIQDVNQYIMSYYNLCAGKFSPRSPGFGKSYQAGNGNPMLYEDIRTGMHKVICINDNPLVPDFPMEKDRIQRLYEEKFPNKSQFEY